MPNKSKGAVPFVSGVPDYEIIDGNMHVSFGEDWQMAMSLRNFERGMAKAARVIADYRAKKAEVVPIRKRRAEH